MHLTGAVCSTLHCVLITCFFSLLELLHSYVSQVCVSTSALCECVLVSCNDSSRDSSSPLYLYCRYQRSSGLIASPRFSETNWAPVNKKKRKKVLIHSSSWQWFSSASPNLEFMNPGYFCGSHRVGYIERLGEEAEQDWEVNGNQTECINYHQNIIDIVAHPARDPSQIMH